MSKDKSIKKENSKKEPAKSLKEKRADKKAKQEDKKKAGWCAIRSKQSMATGSACSHFFFGLPARNHIHCFVTNFRQDHFYPCIFGFS